VTRSLRAKLPAVIAVLFVVWALRGGRPEGVHAPFHSYVPLLLNDLLGRYLSAEQQSEEAIKVMQRGLGSRQRGLSGHHCTAALGMCHGTVRALDLSWMDFRPPMRTRFRDPIPSERFGGRVTAGALAAQIKHDLQLPTGVPVTPRPWRLRSRPEWAAGGGDLRQTIRTQRKTSCAT